MADVITCDNSCSTPAMCNFTWPTSEGPQTANLCHPHADAWWRTYQHTPAGSAVIIGEPRLHEQCAAAHEQVHPDNG